MNRIQQIARKHENVLWEVTAEPSREQIRDLAEAAIREALQKVCVLIVSDDNENRSPALAEDIRAHFEEESQ